MSIQFEPVKPPYYTAYLVRMWQENSQTLWRASAQSVHTGEKVYFASLDALFAFLYAQTAGGIADERGMLTDDER